MKKIYSLLLIGSFATSALVTTSCIDEVEPTDGATQEKIDKSIAAKEALVWAVPAYENQYEVATDEHFDYGLGSIMHIRDVMTEDMAIVSSNYDHYTRWQRNQYMGKDYVYAGFPWIFYNKWVQTANKLIAGIPEEGATDLELGYIGIGYAFRALIYLDMARMYEYLPCKATKAQSAEGNEVTGLTVPIVTEKTTEEEAKNNPRANHDQMFDFILSDLDKAEELIVNSNISNHVIPDIYVVYGLKARLYMWAASYMAEIGATEGEDVYKSETLAAETAQTLYAKAEEYAHKATEGPYTPTTKEQWLNTATGFNSPTDAWMLGSQQVKENDVVQSGIVNWTSWACNETSYGYAAAGPMSMVGKSFYERIFDTDFRKLSWVAPEAKKKLRRQNTFVDPRFEELDEYVSLKFRPGMANFTDYQVGSATAYPMMRVEEMYFIEAEAAAHQDPLRGKDLIEDFMRKYRYDSYACIPTDEDGVVEEIIFQKRVELWGEGQTFFDVKRLNYSVTRNYEDTNFYPNAAINTDGRPAWMNFVIVRTEEANNAGVKGWNNPDPSDRE